MPRLRSAGLCAPAECASNPVNRIGSSVVALAHWIQSIMFTSSSIVTPRRRPLTIVHGRELGQVQDDSQDLQVSAVSRSWPRSRSGYRRRHCDALEGTLFPLSRKKVLWFAHDPELRLARTPLEHRPFQPGADPPGVLSPRSSASRSPMAKSGSPLSCT